MTSVPDFIKLYQLVQNMTAGRDRQNSDVIRLRVSFRKDSKLEQDSSGTARPVRDS
jgi:hypothetical protein